MWLFGTINNNGQNNKHKLQQKQRYTRFLSFILLVIFTISNIAISPNPVFAVESRTPQPITEVQDLISEIETLTKELNGKLESLDSKIHSETISKILAEVEQNGLKTLPSSTTIHPKITVYSGKKEVKLKDEKTSNTSGVFIRKELSQAEKDKVQQQQQQNNKPSTSQPSTKQPSKNQADNYSSEVNFIQTNEVDLGELKKDLISTEWIQIKLQFYLGKYFSTQYPDIVKKIRNSINDFNSDLNKNSGPPTFTFKKTEVKGSSGSKSLYISSNTLKNEEIAIDNNQQDSTPANTFRIPTLKPELEEEDIETGRYYTTIELPTISSTKDQELFGAIKALHRYHNGGVSVGNNFSFLFQDIPVSNTTINSLYSWKLSPTYKGAYYNEKNVKDTSGINILNGSIYDYTLSSDAFDSSLSNGQIENKRLLTEVPYINITSNEDTAGFVGLVNGLVSFDTFLQNFKLRYGYDLTKVYEGDEVNKNIRLALKDWRQQDGKVIDYILSASNDISDFYFNEKTGNEVFKEPAFSENIRSYNNLLRSFGVEEFKSGGKSSVTNIDSFTSLGIIRDLFTKDPKNPNAFYTSNVYNELLAWTSGFIPFSTNTYKTGSETIALSPQATQTWLNYYKLRQPLFITETTNNVYSSLIDGNPARLNYVTLDEYIKRIDKEQDVFLFTNTYSADEIKKINTSNITINDTVNIGTQDGNTKVEQNATTSNDNPNRESISVNNQSSKEEKLDSSFLTSNPRFFGPVYGSSYNYKVNSKAYSRREESELNKSGFNTVSNSTVSNLLNNTTAGNISNIHSLEAIREDGEKVNIDFTNEQLTSFMAQLMTPDNLALNHMLAWNVKEEKTYLLDILQSDLSKPLYMDFLGNIVTESGFVVVPAIANATRFTDNANTTFLHAMFINFYPEVAVTSDGAFSVQDKDKNKLVFYTNDTGWFVKDTAQNVEVEYTGFYKHWWRTWFHNEKINIGKINSSGDGFKNSVEVHFPRVDSFTTNSKILQGTVTSSDLENSESKDLIGAYQKELMDSRGYDNVDDVINMFTTDNFYSQRYGLLFWRKTDNAVFSWTKAFPVTTLSIDGTAGKAYLNKIPATLNSYEVASLTELNNNMIKLSISQNRLFMNLDTALSIVIAINNGSVDTTITDATFIDQKEKLKSDKLSYILGSTFESVYNPFISEVKANELTYLPTPLNLTTVMDFAQNLPIILLVILTITIIVLIIAMITVGQRNGLSSIKDFAKGLIILILTIVIILKGSIPTELAFTYLNNRILENNNLMMALNQLEDEMKNKTTSYFSLEETKPDTETPSIILKKLSTDEAMQYREASERPEDELLYNPAYDNTKEFIYDNIYIQNLYLKIDLKDLFDASFIDTYVQNNYTIKYEHNVSKSANNLAYYIPYFHILESLTNTINKYSEATTNYYNTLSYNSGVTKVTGRVKSYIDSIFFTAPQKVEDYIKLNNTDPTNVESYLKGQLNIGKKENSKDYQNGENVIDTFLNSKGEELIITENIATALEYIYNIMSLENPNDWLGLNYVLNTNSNENIFNENFIETTKATRWFPVLTKYKTDEALQKAIERVNNNTKKFIFKYIDQVSDTVSDENLLRVIALKATLEFNREFNIASKGIVSNGFNLSEEVPKLTWKFLYPYFLDGTYGDTDFISKMVYMPMSDIFRSNGNSLGFYLGNEMSRIGLVFAFLERLLFLIRFLIRQASFIIMSALLLATIFAYIFKRKTFVNTCLKTCLILFIMVSPLLLIEVMCYGIQIFLANTTSLNIVLLANITIGVLLTSCYGVCIKLLVSLFREIFLSFRNSMVSLFNKIQEIIPIGFEPAESYSGYPGQGRSNYGNLPENYVPPASANGDETLFEDAYSSRISNNQNIEYDTINDQGLTPSLIPITEEEIDSIDSNQYSVLKSKDSDNPKYFIFPKEGSFDIANKKDLDIVKSKTSSDSNSSQNQQGNQHLNNKDSNGNNGDDGKPSDKNSSNWTDELNTRNKKSTGAIHTTDSINSSIPDYFSSFSNPVNHNITDDENRETISNKNKEERENIQENETKKFKTAPKLDEL